MKRMAFVLAGLLLVVPATGSFAVEVTPDMNDCQKNCVAQYGPAVDTAAAPSRDYDTGKRARVLAATDALNACLQACGTAQQPSVPAAAPSGSGSGFRR